MKVVLTGSNGFIGKNLLKRFKKLKWYVWEVNVDESSNKAPEYNVIENMIKQCDGVFHVGAISDTTLHDCNKMLYYNYTLSKLIFDLARKYDKKVIYSSSAATYGLGDGLPTNIYGWSKKLAEEYGLKACEKFVALRYFNVYGPGEGHKGKMASVAYQAYQKGSFTLFPKKPLRDFVYISDVVNANLAAFKLDRGIFDVGYGEPALFEDLVGGMGIKFNHTTEDKIPGWYQFYTCADKNMRIPGWKPEYNVQQGTFLYRNNLKFELNDGLK
jgi:ADP-L-glycero-D-manno-heptose 6-epimerase|tara:strand:+ start:2500 stop:3312 length:813 start_codon:yes stop_codon:yes gene_type:complete